MWTEVSVIKSDTPDNTSYLTLTAQLISVNKIPCLQKPIYVALPYHSARPFTVREAVVKAETTEGEWTVLNSAEVTFDNLNYKVRHLHWTTSHEPV